MKGSLAPRAQPRLRTRSRSFRNATCEPSLAGTTAINSRFEAPYPPRGIVSAGLPRPRSRPAIVRRRQHASTAGLPHASRLGGGSLTFEPRSSNRATRRPSAPSFASWSARPVGAHGESPPRARGSRPPSSNQGRVAAPKPSRSTGCSCGFVAPRPERSRVAAGSPSRASVSAPPLRRRQTHDASTSRRRHVWPGRFIGSRHGRRAGSEHTLEDARLDTIVQQRAGPVSAHEIHVGGRHAGRGHRAAHRVLEPTPVGVGGGDVGAVAAARVAEQATELTGRLALAPGSDEARRRAESSHTGRSEGERFRRRGQGAKPRITNGRGVRALGATRSRSHRSGSRRSRGVAPENGRGHGRTGPRAPGAPAVPGPSTAPRPPRADPETLASALELFDAPERRASTRLFARVRGERGCGEGIGSRQNEGVAGRARRHGLRARGLRDLAPRPTRKMATSNRSIRLVPSTPVTSADQKLSRSRPSGVATPAATIATGRVNTASTRRRS